MWNMNAAFSAFEIEQMRRLRERMGGQLAKVGLRRPGTNLPTHGSCLGMAQKVMKQKSDRNRYTEAAIRRTRSRQSRMMTLQNRD